MKEWKYIILAILPICLFKPVFVYTEPENTLFHTISVTILVTDPDKAADALVNWSEEIGGYYLSNATKKIVLRLPAEKVKLLNDMLAGIAEKIVDISFQAADLKEEKLRLQSGIKSRQEILDRNLEFLDRADVEGTLAIEEEVIVLMREIESLKGRLNKINASCRFAHVDINLDFQKTTIRRDVQSSFDWINSMNFYHLIQEGIF